MGLEYAWAEPDPRLRRMVTPYCGYCERADEPVERRELTHPNVTVIVGFGPPLDFPERGFARTSFVAGIEQAPVLTAHRREQSGVQLNLSPLVAGMVFGLPAGKLAREIVELEDVLGADGRDLPERLHAAQSWDRRFAIVDRWLLRRLDAASPPHAGVAAAWARLVASRGRAPIGELAAELGWSRRHLTERFTAAVGVPPKAYARILRFDRAHKLIRRADGATLGQIALDSGYYDQAHLNRDFREFAGVPPTELEWLPNVQDGVANAA
jgi:AraC-like DNA-binding protein